MGGAGQATPLVKQQTVAAGLQGQGPVGALVELVAVVLLGIQLQTFSLGTSNVSDQLTGGRSLALW